MQQRSNKSGDRTIELPSLGYHSNNRKMNNDLQADMIRQMERSMSKESYELSHTKSKKNLSKQSKGSKGSLLNKNKNINNRDNIYNNSMDGSIYYETNRSQRQNLRDFDSSRAYQYRTQKETNLHNADRAVELYTSSGGTATKAKKDEQVQQIKDNNKTDQQAYINKVSAQCYMQNIYVKKFQFSFLSYLIQIGVGYALVIGLMYLITVSASFPYFLILFSLGLMLSMEPYHKSNLLLFIVCTAVIISNYFLQIQTLTYPIILIVYFSYILFLQQNKQKILFIPTLVVVLVWGFVVIPALYRQFLPSKTPTGIQKNIKNFYYVFPIFVALIRIFIYLSYRIIKYTEYLYLQLPMFVNGLEIGVMLSLGTNEIQFWYLIVCYTIFIVNDRTMFLHQIIMSLFKALGNISTSKKAGSSTRHTDSSQNLQQGNKQGNKHPTTHVSILCSHSSAHISTHSFHVICVIYFFILATVYSPPYSSPGLLSLYVTDAIYKPLIIWAFSCIYEGMCLVLQRKRRDKLCVGYVDNGIKQSLFRGAIFAIGLWMLYLGLGVGAYIKTIA